MNWLEGTAAVVTGAGSGIGAAVVRRFVAEGASVVAFDLSQPRLEALASELGPAVTTVGGDVRRFADLERAVAAALDRFGKLDTFVANAGIWDGNRKLGELSADELGAGLDEVFAVNVKGYLLSAKAAAPALARAKGSLIFTLSTSSFYVGGGGGAIYVAAKHAALGLMRALANELAPDVRVNGVAPSGTLTALADAPTLAAEKAIPPGGIGGPDSNLLAVGVTAEDHAGAYVLLASKYGRVMTGTAIASDAGRGVMAGRVPPRP